MALMSCWTCSQICFSSCASTVGLSSDEIVRFHVTCFGCDFSCFFGALRRCTTVGLSAGHLWEKCVSALRTQLAVATPQQAREVLYPRVLPGALLSLLSSDQERRDGICRQFLPLVMEKCVFCACFHLQNKRCASPEINFVLLPAGIREW